MNEPTRSGRIDLIVMQSLRGVDAAWLRPAPLRALSSLFLRATVPLGYDQRSTRPPGKKLTAAVNAA